MKNTDLLPEELLWADGGHASDVVLTALADGQRDIVPEAAQAHVHGCQACTMHLGNAALLSMHAGRELALVAEARPSSVPARVPLPRLAIALALVVAVVGLLPSLYDASSGDVGGVGDAARWATHAPLFAHGLSTLVRHASEGPLGLVLTYGGAALLVATALAVLRSSSQKEVSR